MTNQNNAAQPVDQEFEAIMEQAQVFASAWAFFGGPFDQGDGKEQAEREEARLREVIRDVLSKLRAPVAGPSGETMRLAGVIADKIEDGTLFDAGIFSRRELADKVRAVVRFVQQGAGVATHAAPQASEAQCSCPSGDGSLRHPCAVHHAQLADGGAVDG